MLFSNKINIDKISVSLIEEILGFNEPECILSSDEKEIIENKLLLYSIFSLFEL